MDTSHVPLGEAFGPVKAVVDADEVAAFALAVNDAHGAYLDGRLAPPTYAVALGLPTMRGLANLPPAAIAGARGTVHGEHDLTIHEPIRPGMRVETTATRHAVVTSSAGMSVVNLLRSVDDDGRLLVEQLWSTLYLGEVAGDDAGPRPAVHEIAAEARRRPVGRAILATTRDQTYRYAGASGDREPIHVNDVAAQAIGYPRKLNQGLCTLGIVGRALRELTGNAPAAMRRLAVRFAAPAFPGDDIDVAVYELRTESDEISAYAFEAESDSAIVLRRGRVEFRTVESA